MSRERWRKIPPSRLLGVPAGWGEASSWGRVRRAGRRQVLAGTVDSDGYRYHTVGRQRIGEHVLVCLAWKGKPEVRHLRGALDRQDNRPEVLAWGSRWENEQDKKEGEGKKKREEEYYPPFPSVTPVTGDLRR
jgi:hypothetical protein